jgi:phenylalanine-4-hydroxylase
LSKPEWIDAIAKLDAASGIPHFEKLSEKMRRATGWEIVAVPGLIPDDAFFTHLANRRFPVTVWLRKPEEFDYIVEPDVFHDFFGHVPLLFDRTYADHLYEYGKGGLKANSIRISPPLVITREAADEAADIMEEVLAEVGAATPEKVG